MRISLQEAPVHVSTWVSLVSVHNHVFRIARGVTAELPLSAGGEATSAPATQVRLLDLINYLLGSHLVESLSQCSVPSESQVVLDIRWVDMAVVAENQPRLVLIEGYLGFANNLLSGEWVGTEQLIDDLFLDYRLGHDIRYMLRLNLDVAYLLGIENDQGPLLTKAVAAGPSQVYLCRQTVFVDLLFKCKGDLFAGIGEATGPGAQCDARLLGVSSGDYLLSDLLQFSG